MDIIEQYRKTALAHAAHVVRTLDSEGSAEDRALTASMLHTDIQTFIPENVLTLEELIGFVDRCCAKQEASGDADIALLMVTAAFTELMRDYRNEGDERFTPTLSSNECSEIRASDDLGEITHEEAIALYEHLKSVAHARITSEDTSRRES